MLKNKRQGQRAAVSSQRAAGLKNKSTLKNLGCLFFKDTLTLLMPYPYTL